MSESFDRREFLQATLLVAGVGAATAAPGPTSARASTLGLASVPASGIAEEFETRGRDIWPEFTEILKPIESKVRRELDRANQKRNPYSGAARMVEYQLSRARARLDECFVLRDKAHEMEIDACKATWNQLLVRYRTNHEGHFEDEYYTHLSFASGEQYLPTQQIQAGDLTPSIAFGRVRNALAERRKTTIAFEEALQVRRKADFSGFNYVQRHAALRKRFVTALVEAYQRCRAVDGTLKQCFGIATEVPDIDALTGPTGILDGLSGWLNETLATLEGALGFDVESEINVWLKGDLKSTMPPTSTAGNPSVAFSLDQHLFAPGYSPRLLGLSISVSVPEKIGNKFPRAEFSIDVKAPGFSTGVAGIARVINSKFRLEPAPIKSIELANSNPIGAWTVSFANKGTGRPASLKATSVSDILLSLRVATISREK